MNISRIIGAFLLAPGITALAFGLVMQPDKYEGWAAAAAMVTYAHTLILGVPAFLMLRNRLNPTTVAGASFAIGALPLLVLVSISTGDYSMVNGEVLVEHGRTTWAGYVSNLQTAAIGGILGLATGAVWMKIAGIRQLSPVTSRPKVYTWLALVLSGPAAVYAAGSFIFYVWLNAADPVRWPAERAAVWAYSALALAVVFGLLFIYCVVSIVRSWKKSTEAARRRANADRRH